MVKRKAATAGDQPNKKTKEMVDKNYGNENGDGSGSGSEDESAEEGEEQEEDEEENKDSQPAQKATSQLTSQEVQVARETAELYKSNVFKMQIDELLKELKLSDKRCEQLQKTLFEINNVLQSTPETTKEYTIDQVEKAVPDVTIPFPDPIPKGVNYKFQFARPDDINVVGSYSLKTSVKQPEGVEVDLYAQMPQSLFQAKDYVNYRYFHKRAFYLAVLAKHLNSSHLPGKMKYSNFRDDPLKPIIRIKLDNGFIVNILVGVENTVFEPRKLGPDRNCVRLTSESSDPGHVVPTPLYNSSLLSDTTYLAYLKYMHTASKQCEGYAEACKLGRLWLRQRGLGSSMRQGGFGHFEFAMLMAVLLCGNSKVLMNGFSSYQLFKATVKFLATDLGNTGVTFALGESATVGVKEMHDFPALLYDTKTRLNIFYKMSGWSCGMLQHEARLTSDMLNDVVRDRFDSIFMKDVSLPHLRYDVVFRVRFGKGPFLPADKIKYASYRHYFGEKVWRDLKRGYGDRVKQIAMFDVSSKPWNFNKRKAADSENVLQVGLVLDPQEADKILTHGPEAEDEAAAKRFAEFWGISELRRFQNGRIAETVEWSVSPSKPVVVTIAEHLLKYRFRDVECEIDFDNRLLQYVPVCDVAGVRDGSMASTKLFAAKHAAFDRLANAMRELKDVPLFVRSVTGTSSSLRYTSLHQPLPFDVKSDDAMASGVIEFETSTRWPDDLVAIEKTKTAFMLKISEQLEKLGQGHVAFVGVETVEGLEVGVLHVQTPDGYMFKLRVHTDKDLALYTEQDIPELLLHYKRTYPGAIAHTRMVHRMALRYPYYSASVRLLKQWLNSQLLLGPQTITEETIELLALTPFINSAPYSPPASATTAFNRVLEFIARWDWRQDPVILDVQRSQDPARDEDSTGFISDAEGVDMSSNDYAALSAAFTSERTVDQALTVAPLVIPTAADQTGVLWTQQVRKSDVGKMVASRLTSLARGVSQMMLEDEPEYDTWFTPALDDYDVVIHTVDPHGDSSSGPKYKNLALKQSFPSLEQCIDWDARVVDAFYADLASKFGHELVLFKGGNSSQSRRPRHGVIAGIWNRVGNDTKKFKVNLGFNSAPTGSGDAVQLNKDAVVAMVRRIGSDLVQNVSYK